MVIEVQQLIRCALQDIGAIAKQESPSADEMADGLLKLNIMIDAWSVRSLVVLGTILEGFALDAGKAAYTIGEAGDFRTAKPSAVTDAFVRDGSGVDSPLSLIGREDYDALPDKLTATGRPSALFFDAGPVQAATQTGVVSLYPAPAGGGYTLFLGEQKPLSEFSALTDAVTFAPAYYEALEYNLALRLWRQYHEDGRPIPADIVVLARDAMRVIETMNGRRVTSRMEVPGGRRGGYSVLAGSGAPV